MGEPPSTRSVPLRGSRERASAPPLADHGTEVTTR